MEFVDITVDDNEYGYEYEPIAADNESDSYELPALEGDEYLIDPIKADLFEFKGGYDTDWELLGSGGGYTFDGEQVRNMETGDAWAGFSEDTIGQLRTSEYVRLDDIEADGKLVVTYLKKGPDNSITYEMHATDLQAANDNEIGSIQEFGWEDTTYAVAETPTYSGAKPVEISPVSVLEAEHAAAVEADEPDTVEEIIAPVTLEARPQFDEFIATTVEAGLEAEQAIEYSYAEIAHPQEMQAQIFGEFLAMEQLPAITIENDLIEPIILKAPEPVKKVPQKTEVVLVEHVETNITAAETIPDNVPRVVEAQTIEATFTQNEVAQEVVEKPGIAVQIRSEMPRIEQPLVVEAQKTDVQNVELPPYDVKDEIKEEAPVVAEHKEKPIVRDVKESTQEVKAKEPKVVELSRGRRGRERFASEAPSRRRHEDEVERIREKPRSIAENAVEQTLERFAAEMARERPTQKEDAYQEPPVAMKAVVESDNEPIAAVVEQVQITENIAPILVEQQPVASSETSRRTGLESSNVIPFPDVARPERVRTEIENILEQLRLPRAVATPEVIRAANENLQFAPGTRAQPLGTTDESASDLEVKRNGVIMRMPNRRRAA